MKKKIQEAWIKDLETTKAPQRPGRLGKKSGGKWGYCCLGRLALVLEKHFPEALVGFKIKKGSEILKIVNITTGEPEAAYLPDKVRRACGMSAVDMHVYTQLNDSGEVSFKDIALLTRKKGAIGKLGNEAPWAPDEAKRMLKKLK